MTGRMRAATQDRYGGPEVLRITTMDLPTPGPRQVLVRVRAASINYGEAKVRSGLVAGITPPFTLGSDLSGEVAATGPGVSDFRPGEEVYGIFFIGTFAEYVVVPASHLARKPESLDHVHAAALPVAAQTAQTAVDQAQLREGQRVLVHAAAGGVGHLAVQLAKLRGAYVVGTARAAKHDFLRGLGADETVDYTAVDFATAVRDMDVVFDLIGGEYGERSLETLRPGGLLLGAALDPGMTAGRAKLKGQRFEQVGVRPSGVELQRISDLVEKGELRVHVERTYPLEELAEAHRYSETGRVTGKLVIVL